MIPRSLVFASRPIRYWLEKQSYRTTHQPEHIKAYKDRYAGKPVLVVGNGPSLNRTPLDDFESIPSIGMNKINLIFPRVHWRPTAIVCVNSLVAHQNQEFFGTTQIPTFLSWKARHVMKRKHRKSPTFFVENLSNEFSYDASQGIGSSDTVTYAALQLAHYLGANPVILVGVDHSFESKGRPNEIRRTSGPDTNHFDPNYFASGMRWGVPNLEASEIVYRLAQQAYQKAGREIFDATVGGKLTVFPKISMADALALASRPADV